MITDARASSLRVRGNRNVAHPFGPGAIEAAVRLYGAERIVCGTDGTEFGCEWTSKALAEAAIGEDARAKILHSNAKAMMSRLGKVAQRETVAA